MLRKMSYEEILALAPKLEDIKAKKKRPIVIIVDNIRSLHNVGAILRTADAAGVERVYLCG